MFLACWKEKKGDPNKYISAYHLEVFKFKLLIFVGTLRLSIPLL